MRFLDRLLGYRCPDCGRRRGHRADCSELGPFLEITDGTPLAIVPLLISQFERGLITEREYRIGRGEHPATIPKEIK